MANAKKIGGLGRGLQALLSDMQAEDLDPAASEAQNGGTRQIRLDRVEVNPYQPRRSFDEETLRELTDSVRTHGVLQPVLLRAHGEGFQLIAGERRLRAARLAGLTEIPALVREMTDREMMELSIIENIQRQDLDPVEEAAAYRRLSGEFGQTQEQIARRVAKSRAYVANSMRLLHLPEAILARVSAGVLTVGQVRPLLVLDEAEAVRLAERLVAENGTARDAERWAREAGGSGRPGAAGDAAAAGEDGWQSGGARAADEGAKARGADAEASGSGRPGAAGDAAEAGEGGWQSGGARAADEGAKARGADAEAGGSEGPGAAGDGRGEEAGGARAADEGAKAREADAEAGGSEGPDAAGDGRGEEAGGMEAPAAGTDPPAAPDAAGREAGVKKPEALPAELKEIQRILREQVNTKVEITRGSKGGKIVIDFYTQDDIERILELFTGNKEVS